MRESTYLPESLAIAGAWGYIGRKFLAAAQALGIRVSVHDPGPVPQDLDLSAVTRIEDERAFYRQPADMFHLALHPEARQTGLDLLMRREGQEPLLVLCEKPMAPPDQPIVCLDVLRAAERSTARLLYDFPEWFDPISARIRAYLSRFRQVQWVSMFVQRSKDREDPAQPRNCKRMVPIQYQESVHCLAFVLQMLSAVRGSAESAFSDGLTVTASAEPYEPPNPEAYPYVVDGKCRYRLTLGLLTVEGITDFKRGAQWTKRRVLRGLGDGVPFLIEAEFLEGHKRLVINGESQADVAATDSYQEVIKSFANWSRTVPLKQWQSGLYPNPAFARIAYQLSSVLWRSSCDARSISLSSLDELLAFDAGFAAALPRLPRY